MLPISRGHPVITQPVEFRAYAALPAAGAWDADPDEFAIAGYRTLMLYISYLRDAAGGAFEFKLEASPYSADVGATPARDWFQQSLYSPDAVVAGSDAVSEVQRESVSYTATGATIETFVYGPIDLGIGIERLRISGRETGDTDNPGSLEVIGLLGMEA